MHSVQEQDLSVFQVGDRGEECRGEVDLTLGGLAWEGPRDTRAWARGRHVWAERQVSGGEKSNLGEEQGVKSEERESSWRGGSLGNGLWGKGRRTEHGGVQLTFQDRTLSQNGYGSEVRR